jgi:hypothetical protein
MNCSPHPLDPRSKKERLFQCQDCSIQASRSSALPDMAGFYWWRKYPNQEWRMVRIVDFAEGYPSEPPHLAAYDVEYQSWGGRTLRMWAIHDPIGQWMPCRKPNDHE